MSTTAVTQFTAAHGRLLLAVALAPKEIGRRIKAARDAKHWSQLQFALSASVSPSTVSRWERGYLPPVRELMRIADVLEVPAETLVEPERVEASVSARLARLEEEASETRAILLDVAKALGVPARPAPREDEQPAV